VAKFNPTITAYLVPYIKEVHKKNFCYWVSLLFKVEHISYTMGTHALPGIYIYIYIYTCPWTAITYIYKVCMLYILSYFLHGVCSNRYSSQYGETT